MTNAADETDYFFDQAFWDAQYRTRSQLWSGRPNGHLVAQAAELPAGAALDVGGGEGADAIWLAERGWRVTAVDVSAVALERGAQHAAEAGTEVAAQIAWHHEDVRTWAPEPSSYDLVSAQFMHLTPADRTSLIGRLAAAVAPGGTLLVVGHHPSDLETTVSRGSRPELLFTATELAALLDAEQWEIVLASAPGRRATDPAGNPVTIHDALLRARRR
jgi:2-polyprenyl-3-methyl-5-hydroxy-6-metoxy-1,4-benzoquinol methylase